MQEMSNPGPRPNQKGPGEFLADARRRLGMEPENVAQMLRLSTQQIIAIEADDFKSLPEPTYVRGYLRSYSQLLNVDSEDVIRTYNQAIGGWKTATYSGLSTEKQATSNDKIVRFATMGVIGLVIGLAMVWWLGQDDSIDLVPAPAEVAVAPTEVAEPEIKLDIPTPEPAPVETAAVPVAPATTEVAGVKPALPVIEEKPAVPAATETTPAAVIQPKPQVADAPKPVATPPPEINIPAGTRSRLVLRTQGVSWVDIRDASDNRLLYESVEAGREIAIEGESPIQVFLGNADAVSLEFNGANYNFSAHKQGKWARFTLGQVVKNQPVQSEEQ